MPVEKYLWLVNYSNIDNVMPQAVAAGITTLAVRTSNNIPHAIQAGHDAGLKVFGWRWPLTNASCMAEANAAADYFANHGMDGYFVDPEGSTVLAQDWNQPGLDALADQFCQTVKASAAGKPFGVTSHFHAGDVFPKLPWATFVRYADVLLPQSYWRSTEGVIRPGDPVKNYDIGLAKWGALTATPDIVVPMAGELGSVTGPEIAAYAEHANQLNKPQHYYTWTAAVAPAVWQAIKAG